MFSILWEGWKVSMDKLDVPDAYRSIHFLCPKWILLTSKSKDENTQINNTQ